MASRSTAWRLAVHLTGVGFVGYVLTAVQFAVALVALFTGRVPVFVAVSLVVAAGAVGLLAGFAAAAQQFVPLARTTRGRWVWAGGVYAFGAAGTVGAAVLTAGPGGPGPSWLLYLWGGGCYALGAAFFLPGPRIRYGALGVTAALAVGVGYAAWASAQPPTLDAWLTANGVDRALLRLGEPPTGYVLRVNGASESGFGAEYERPGAAGLHLSVTHPDQDTRRTDAHGCPVLPGVTVTCTDDGGGRQLVAYDGFTAWRELRLRRGGLIHTVSLSDRPDGLRAARHVLSTLRPATDAELSPLRALPMRR
ncbi:hypothetical protein [Streptomyces lunalinharesii]|uniref:Uncharacterized protein n=1 Tax=Streptomyces lunalinharesii TaxID=333384 RepID=A0ABP6EG38_9ACTN